MSDKAEERQMQAIADYCVQRDELSSLHHTVRTEFRTIHESPYSHIVQVDPLHVPGGPFRELITLDRHVRFATWVPTVTVNWGSIGAVPIEQAEQFARALLAAAERAKDMRRAAEQAHPPLWAALQEHGIEYPMSRPTNA